MGKNCSGQTFILSISAIFLFTQPELIPNPETMERNQSLILGVLRCVCMYLLCVKINRNGRHLGGTGFCDWVWLSRKIKPTLLPAISKREHHRITGRKLEIKSAYGGRRNKAANQMAPRPAKTPWTLPLPPWGPGEPTGCSESNSGGNQKWFRSTCPWDGLTNSHLFPAPLWQKLHIPANTLMCCVPDTHGRNYSEAPAKNKEACVDLYLSRLFQVR